jgi:hypothetical protein
MDFRIDCPCGGHMTVTEGSAGATLTCACGRPVSVPSLPALRVAAGRTAEVLGPEQIVGRLLAAGKLPGTKDCIGCGFDTDQILDVFTECETQYRTSSEMPLWLCVILSVISLPFALLFSRGGETEWHGRDTSFLLPVPVCEQCQRPLHRRQDAQTVHVTHPRVWTAARQVPLGPGDAPQAIAACGPLIARIPPRRADNFLSPTIRCVID